MPDVLFPHDVQRPIQKELVQDIVHAIKTKTPLIVHAPTGLGKTAASLGPAVAAALEQGLTVFFLTSRHTHHELVSQTIAKIKEKFKVPLLATSVVGKKWMCAQNGASSMLDHDFREYCKNLRNHDSCDYYTNAKELSTAGQVVIEQIKEQSPMRTEQLVGMCAAQVLCPYEVSLNIAKQATVIVADYFYIFSPVVRQKFLAKIGKTLDKSIVVIDEGHNVPSRIRSLMTSQLSNFQIQRAVKEAKKYELDEVLHVLVDVQDALNVVSESLVSGGEALVEKAQFMKRAAQTREYDEAMSLLELGAEIVHTHQPQSSLSGIADFLDAWMGPDEGFARIARRNDPHVALTYQCLDPSVVIKHVVPKTHTTIVMSGTLSPAPMYRDLLGLPAHTVVREYPSPFPSRNRLVLVVPKTTTKYTARSEKQFEEIARHCGNILSSVPGSSALFFPSYYLRDIVYKHLEPVLKKTCFLEQSGMSKEEKQSMLDRFRTYKEAVLLGVAAGSFGEGIDLPGVFDCIIIVGLPLDRPDLETQQLIAYYDKTLGRGWDFGYVLPAMTKTLQNAGRCIRTEKDRGVIIFLDERYVQPQYRRYFPTDWEVKITTDYVSQMRTFFGI